MNEPGRLKALLQLMFHLIEDYVGCSSLHLIPDFNSIIYSLYYIYIPSFFVLKHSRRTGLKNTAFVISLYQFAVYALGLHRCQSEHLTTAVPFMYGLHSNILIF